MSKWSHKIALVRSRLLDSEGKEINQEHAVGRDNVKLIIKRENARLVYFKICFESGVFIEVYDPVHVVYERNE